MKDKDYVIICAWCYREKIAGEWVFVKEHYKGSNISHGMCPDCHKRELENNNE